MEETRGIKTIARIHTAFPGKFGIPRQSGLVEQLRGRIIFEPEYRNVDAVRGLEEFSHLWLIWEFSQTVRDTWSPTVRPPRLGGNERLGVFATRSPFRPNPIGLSCVKLDGVEQVSGLGPVLHVLGADLMDKTPIYDIKPYLPYVDAHPEALGGFARNGQDYQMEVEIPLQWLELVPEGERAALMGVLAQDLRPAYQQDAERVYGFFYGDMEIKFTVRERRLTVCEIIPCARSI